MTKTAVIVAVLVLGAVVIFGSFGRDSAEAPIVDEACEPGTTRVGEGCMPLKVECEIRGDQYYFDESKQECLTR